MGLGLQRAFAAARATRASPPTEHELEFLRELARWTGAATPRELGPQTSQHENSARQACKRKGLAIFDGHYWRLTDDGKAALRTGY